MIRIITDSASDIDLCNAAALGVTVLPMQIQIGEKTYRDRYDIYADDFYRMLIENDTLPKTSQINPFASELDRDKGRIAVIGKARGSKNGNNMLKTAIFLRLKRFRSAAPSEPMPVPERLLQPFSGHEILLEKYRVFYYDAFRT